MIGFRRVELLIVAVDEAGSSRRFRLKKEKSREKIHTKKTESPVPKKKAEESRGNAECDAAALVMFCGCDGDVTHLDLGRLKGGDGANEGGGDAGHCCCLDCVKKVGGCAGMTIRVDDSGFL